MWRIEREGVCRKCGDCCVDKYGYKCCYLTESRTCRVYANRPEWCVDEYPRSYDTLSSRCGYSFKRINVGPVTVKRAKE